MRQTLCDGYLVIFALAQAVILLMLTPLFTGISRQIRARMHSRRGPGIWQDYRDIHKLFKRQEVAPTSSGLMFRLMPWVLISSMLVLAKWGLGLKQVVMAALFVALFLPFGRAQELSLACLLTSLVVTLLKVLLIFVLASIAENTLARGRFLLIHHVTWLGFSLAALAWVFWLTGL
ncbi:hypothetical protein H1678_001275 [Escherichia coli]|nr:hypothetical protein [Escherichia coli]